MKLLILSDSHGRLDLMRQAVNLEQPDEIFHLGDYVRDARALGREFPEIPVYAVPGNCDGRTDLADELFLTREGVRLMLCHGHTYSVKLTYLRAKLAAQEAGARVLLFGHTHRQYCEEVDGLWMLNPGASGFGLRMQYGLVVVENGQVWCRVESNEVKINKMEASPSC